MSLPEQLLNRMLTLCIILNEAQYEHILNSMRFKLSLCSLLILCTSKLQFINNFYYGDHYKRSLYVEYHITSSMPII